MSILTGKTILVVDDEKDLREAIAFEFDMLGCIVLQAGSGREGIAIVTDGGTHIDIVLSDIRMADGDGVELLREIRLRHPTAPIVAMVTGFTNQSDSDLKRMGAIDVFKKPIKMDLLLRGLENALANA